MPRSSRGGDEHHNREPLSRDLRTVKKDDNSNAQETNSMEDLEALLGFGGFGSTKQKHVLGNSAGAVYKESKPPKYRQYMNRPGGFNRPLDR